MPDNTPHTGDREKPTKGLDKIYLKMEIAYNL